MITITGHQFGASLATLDIAFGPATCVPVSANHTTVVCQVQDDAVSGFWDLKMRKNREGSAYVSALSSVITLHVVMRVDSVYPQQVS